MSLIDWIVHPRRTLHRALREQYARDMHDTDVALLDSTRRLERAKRSLDQQLDEINEGLGRSPGRSGDDRDPH